MPTAELEVYYGFTKNFVRMHGQEQVDRYMEQLRQPGVTFHGTYSAAYAHQAALPTL
jgi:hypothetical protein